MHIKNEPLPSQLKYHLSVHIKCGESKDGQRWRPMQFLKTSETILKALFQVILSSPHVR